MSYLIYKITNNVNQKVYIGKTKEYYGETYFGIEGRFRNHLTCAFTKSKYNDCPKLYNAIRKYGKDSFQIELIETTDENNIDEREIYYIDYYQSTSDSNGYNIALGGGGRSVNYVSEEIRQKISQSLTKSSEQMNIKPYYNEENICIGYRARRRENGKIYHKYFTSTKFTPEENLAKANEWIELLKTNKCDITDKYNRKYKLPKNIHAIKDKVDKTIIVGYSVNIMKNDIKISKSFINKHGNLEELLNKAIEFKNKNAK